MASSRKTKPDAPRADAGYFTRRRARFFKNVRKGRGVSVDFFRQNGWVIVFFTVVILMLIGMRYRTRIYMKQIHDLKQELKEAHNELIAAKSSYMSMIRETDLVNLTQSHHLGLEFPLNPPYILPLDEADSVKTAPADYKPQPVSPSPQ